MVYLKARVQKETKKKIFRAIDVATKNVLAEYVIIL